MKHIIIGEKPSVGRTYADILGVTHKEDGYMESEEWIVTWAVGHLVKLSYPEKYDEKYEKWNLDDLPFLPEKYKYEVIQDVRKQFAVIKKLYNRSDIDCIYLAGDSGREGLYIMELILMLTGHAPGIALKVVWLDSQTEAEVLKGIREAKPLSDYNLLADSGYMRAIEDYAVGINFSRALSLLYGKILNNAVSSDKYIPISVGRVMTCVLGMIVQREYEISSFKPTTFYKIHSKIEVEGHPFTAEWKVTTDSKMREASGLYNNNGFLKEEDAKKFIETLSKSVSIKNVSTTTEKKKSPLLFNLAELQSECSKRFKINPAKTLEVAQSLYEKKLTTYPRTDARVLSTAIGMEIEKNLQGLKAAALDDKLSEHANDILVDGSYKGITKTRYVDDSKVTDHYALIPTGDTRELAGLSDLERKVYYLVVRRFLAIFLPPAEYAKLSIEEKESPGTESFFYTGKVLTVKGYLILYENEEKEKSGEELAQREASKLLSEGDIYDASYTIKSGETQPPKRYTSGSIILAMENAGNLIEEEELREQIKANGIGTSATRAETIDKLCRLMYIKIDNKTQIIYPMSLGYMVYEVVRATIPTLLSPKMTASWEKGLNEIVDGKVEKSTYQDKLCDYIRKQIATLKGCAKTEEIKALIAPYAKEKGGGREVGKEVEGLLCPACKSSVRVSKYGYMCSKYNKDSGCNFSIGLIAGVILPEKELVALFNDGKTGTIKGFKSKSGKKFDAKLKLTGENTIEFDFPEREPDTVSEYTCRCGKRLIGRQYSYECSCGVKLPKEVAGHRLTEEDITLLMSGNPTTLIRDLKAKSGNAFAAALEYKEDGGVTYKFPEKGEDVSETTSIVCRYCKSMLTEERWNFVCGCGVKIPKLMCGKSITRGTVEELMRRGKTNKMPGFKSKSGKAFTAALTIKDKKVELKFR